MNNTSVLLLNPSSNQGDLARFNAGLLLIGSYLDANGIDCTVYFGANDLLRGNMRLDVQEPDLIGISMMTPQIHPAIELINWCKETFPNVPLILGGYHPTLYPEQTLRHPGVDLVAVGSGEKTIIEILEHLGKGVIHFNEGLHNIPGLAFFDSSKALVITSSRSFSDLKSLPPMNYSLVKDYKPISMHIETGKRVKMGLVLAGIGCVYKCTYCVNSILENKWQGRKTEDILNDVTCLVKKWGVNHIYLLDELFFCNNKRVAEFVESLEKSNLKITWFGLNHISTIRPGFLDADLLRRLRSSGCTIMLIGVESGSPRVLDLINKKTNLNQIREAVRAISNSGIVPLTTFMLGMPDEEEGDMIRTFGLIRDLLSNRPRPYVVISLFRPYPGSVMAKRAYALGHKEPNELAEWGGEHHLWNERSLLTNMPWLSDAKKTLVLDILDVVTVYMKFRNFRNPKMVLFQVTRYFLSMIYGSRVFFWMLEKTPYLDLSAASVFRPNLKETYRRLCDRYSEIVAIDKKKS